MSREKPDPPEEMEMEVDDEEEVPEHPEPKPDISVIYLEVFLRHGVDPNTIITTDDDASEKIPLFINAFRERNFPFMKVLAGHPKFQSKEALQQINQELSPLDEIRETLLAKTVPQAQSRKRSRYDPDDSDNQ